jgi:hypothetical protein
MSRLFWATLTAVILTAGAPAAVQAATPFTAGSGSNPAVAVGSDGSAHVAWVTQGANDQVGYCRVSPGTESCGRSELLTFPSATAASAAGRAMVFVPSPNTVVIVASCHQCPTGSPANKTFRWRSTDNGSTFVSGSDPIGEGFATNGAGAWIEPNLFVAANSNSVRALSLPPVGANVQIAPAGYSFGSEVARLPSTNTLVGASNNLDAVGYRVYNAGTLTAAAINNAGNWEPIRSLSAPESANSATTLNTGPNGVFLAYKSQAPGSARLGLRRFDPSSGSFGAPVYVQGDASIDTGSLDMPDSFQDSTGSLHFVWRSAHGGGRLRYRASDSAGTSFGPVGNLAAGETFTNPEVGVGNGSGFAVWTQGVTGPVRVVRVDPQPEPVLPPVGGDPAAGLPPALSGARIGDRTLRPGQGTSFRFTTSKPGAAVLTIEKQFKGLKAKRKGKRVCLPQNKKRLRALRRQAGSPRAYRKLRKQRTCRAFRRIGEIRQPVKAGVNTIAFDGRVAGRALRKGSYRATLVITDSAGQRSRAETLSFKVVGQKKKTAKGKRGSTR